jgi:hypothetical protein
MGQGRYIPNRHGSKTSCFETWYVSQNNPSTGHALENEKSDSGANHLILPDFASQITFPRITFS